MLGAGLNRDGRCLAQAVAHAQLQPHDAGPPCSEVVPQPPRPPHHRPARQPLLQSQGLGFRDTELDTRRPEVVWHMLCEPGFVA